MIKFLLRHKFAVIFLVIVAAGGGYYAWTRTHQAPTAAKYQMVEVQKGTLVSSVAGTGQISAQDQVDIKAQASGNVTYVGAKNGDHVKAGQVLVRLDPTDAQKAVRDAQTSLESAQLALQKMLEPPDQLTLLQDQNAIDQANQQKQAAQDDLKKSYDDGYTDVANSFIDLPTVMQGLYDVLYGSTASQASQSNLDFYADSVKNFDMSVFTYRDDADQAYQTAKAKYDQNFADYKASSRYSDTATIEAMVNETYDTTKAISEALKSASNLIQFYEDNMTTHNLKPVAVADQQVASLSTYTGQANSHLSSLLSDQQTFKNDKDAITNADQSIQEKTAALAKLQAGADPLDIQSQQLTIKQRQNALQDAKDNLANYTATAQFDGVVAAIDVNVDDSIGSGTVLATLITTQKIAEVPFNEVDAVKIQIGQKATVTFDAIEGLSISGQVVEVDTLGTVSQGVVNYNVQVGFDTQDARVKPGLSVTAGVITSVKSDVLLLPSSAVKASGQTNYVLVLPGFTKASDLPSGATSSSGMTATVAPLQQAVEVGASNDTSTEIVTGLAEGDAVVLKTLSSGSSSTGTAGTKQGGGSILPIPGVGGGGGNIRFRAD